MLIFLNYARFCGFFHSSENSDSNSCHYFSVVKAIANGNGTFCFRLYDRKRATPIAIAIVGRAKTIEMEIKKRSKELILKITALTVKGAIEKSPILLSQHWKKTI